MKSYNLQLVDKMCRGNKEQIDKMVGVFITQITESMAEMDIAYTAKDFLKLKSITHKVKPTLTYFGTVELEKEFILTDNLLSEERNTAELESRMANLMLLAQKVVYEMKTDFNLKT